MFKEKERSGNLLACVDSKSNYVSEIAHCYKIKQYLKKKKSVVVLYTYMQKMFLESEAGGSLEPGN